MVRRIIFKDFVVRVNFFHSFLVRKLTKFGKHCTRPWLSREILINLNKSWHSWPSQLKLQPYLALIEKVSNLKIFTKNV